MKTAWHFSADNPLLLKFDRDTFRYPSYATPFLEWLRVRDIVLYDLDNFYYYYELPSQEAKLDFVLRFYDDCH